VKPIVHLNAPVMVANLDAITKAKKNEYHNNYNKFIIFLIIIIIK
jgi:hypothetical protein